MSTTTAERHGAPSARVKEPPTEELLVQKAKVKKVKADKKLKKATKKARLLARRIAAAAKHLAKKWWKKYKHALRELRARALKAYQAARAVVIATARWTRAKSRWLVDGAIVLGVRTWSWTSSAAFGAWVYTAPVRAWAFTPFRLAFGTTLGLSAVLAFGPVSVVALTIPWIAFLLVSGRLLMVRKTKVAKTRTVLIGTDVGSDYTMEQGGALLDRRSELDSRMATASDKNMISELIGRMYVVTMRMAGSTDPGNELIKQFREYQEAETGVEEARDLYNWTAVKRGVLDEDKYLAKLLAAALVPAS